MLIIIQVNNVVKMVIKRNYLIIHAMIVAKNITKADNNIYQLKRKEIFNIIFCTIHDLIDVFNAVYRIFENVFSIVNEIMIS